MRCNGTAFFIHAPESGKVRVTKNSQRAITIYYLNVRGLNSKLQSIYESLLCCDFEIIALTETWLSHLLSNSEIANFSYVLYRADRRTNKRGGGCLLAISSSIRHQSIDLTHVNSVSNDIDTVGVLVYDSNITTCIVTVYIPPSTHEAVLTEYIDALAIRLLEYDKIIILGDFNVPSFVSPTLYDRKYNAVHNFFEMLELVQINNVLNSKSRLLDLIACSAKIRASVSRNLEPMLPEDVFHPALNITVEYKCEKRHNFPNSVTDFTYDFRKANYPTLYAAISSSDWSLANDHYDINRMIDSFYDRIYSILKQHVPPRKSRPNIYPCWFSRELIDKIKAKNVLYKKLKKSKCASEIQLEYKQSRTICRTMVRNAHKSYIDAVQRDLSHNPKGLWNFIKSKGGRTRIPGRMRYNDKYVETPTEIASAFATYFHSVYRPDTREHSSVNTARVSGGAIAFTENEVLCAAKLMRESNAVGDDGIPMFLVRDCIGLWANPLTNIFNEALRQRVFPERWKITRIIPILKSGDVNDIKNYRPIALISIFGKLFEKLLYKRLFFMVKHKLSPLQHGFYPGRSTSTNLVTAVEVIARNMDSLIQTDVIYTDFEKAFDSIDHELLLTKLSRIGIGLCFVDFLRSYLSDRKLYVFYRGVKSAIFYATSGVPQGANLGTLLFLVFMNDIVVELGDEILLFADDLKLLRSIRHVDDTSILQCQLSRLSQWCLANNIKLNVGKCAVISFTRSSKPIMAKYVINGVILARATSFKDLGVTFQTDLSFRHHYNAVAAAASRTAGFVMRSCRGFKNIETLRTLYFSLVRSKLEYASIVWSPHERCHIERLEAVQRKYLKFLHFKKYGVYPERGCSHQELLQLMQIPSLKLRRRAQDLCFLRGLVNGTTDSSFLLERLNFYIPRQNSKLKFTFYVEAARKDYYKLAPINRICEESNRIREDIDLFHTTNKNIMKCILSESAKDNLH